MKFLNKLNLFTDRLTLKKEFTCFWLRTRNKHLLETCVGFVFLVIFLHTSVTFFSFSQNHKIHRGKSEIRYNLSSFQKQTNEETKKCFMELLHPQIYCWQDSCNYFYITKGRGTYEQFSMFACIFERLSNEKALLSLFSNGAIANYFDILLFCNHIDLFETNFCFFLFTFLENNLMIWLMYTQNPRYISLYIFEYGQEAALIMCSKKDKTNVATALLYLLYLFFRMYNSFPIFSNHFYFFYNIDQSQEIRTLGN